jgi:hypothetical protein
MTSHLPSRFLPLWRQEKPDEPAKNVPSVHVRHAATNATHGRGSEPSHGGKWMQRVCRSMPRQRRVHTGQVSRAQTWQTPMRPIQGKKPSHDGSADGSTRGDEACLTVVCKGLGSRLQTTVRFGNPSVRSPHSHLRVPSVRSHTASPSAVWPAVMPTRVLTPGNATRAWTRKPENAWVCVGSHPEAASPRKRREHLARAPWQTGRAHRSPMAVSGSALHASSHTRLHRCSVTTHHPAAWHTTAGRSLCPTAGKQWLEWRRMDAESAVSWVIPRHGRRRRGGSRHGRARTAASRLPPVMTDKASSITHR